jgi:hypothetical protein
MRASGDMKDTRRKTTACQDAMEANTVKTGPDPGMTQSVEEHQGIPKREIAVMPVGGLRKRRRVRKQAAERRQKPRVRS